MSSRDDYEQVFTPGAPVCSRDFLFGREQELSDVERYTRRPGLHPIVIGNRGVGKTSLVRLGFAGTKAQTLRIGCDKYTTFQTLAREIVRATGVDIQATQLSDESTKAMTGKGTPFGIGISTTGEQKKTTTRKGPAAENWTPWAVFERLRTHRQKLIIVVDEYDAIGRQSVEFHDGIAFLIKHLADNSDQCDSRIVVAGIAQSAQELLGGHESIERSAREIYLRPLRREDVGDFLDHAEERLQLTFTPFVRTEIIDGSMGYPYYVHLVGLECVDAMLARDRRAHEVNKVDYQRATVRAVQHAFRSELRKYRAAVDGLDSNELALIRELTEHTSRQPKRKELQQKLAAKRILSTREFDHTWVKLQQEKKLLYVSRNRDEIRFADPLMEPFLRTWIFRSGPGPTQDPNQLSLFD